MKLRMKTKLLVTALFLSACVSPSTLMVNREGKGVRCATTGYGYGVAGAIAMSAAQQSHNSCVSDYGKLGYVKIPDTAVGINVEWNGPMIVKEVKDPAKTVGIQTGDEVLSIDGKPVANTLDTFKALDGKSVGDKVKVVVKRDNRELTFEPVLVTRGE